MNSSEAIGSAIGAAITTIIIALILAALVHFISGDYIISVLALYIIAAYIPSYVTNTSIDKSSSTAGSLIAVVIVFLLLNFAFPMIFGPNISFPYSILDLGPVITGLILSLIVGVVSLLVRI